VVVWGLVGGGGGGGGFCLFFLGGGCCLGVGVVFFLVFWVCFFGVFCFGGLKLTLSFPGHIRISPPTESSPCPLYLFPSLKRLCFLFFCGLPPALPCPDMILF